LRVTKPIYFYHDRPVVYHGEGMTRKLNKLRDVNSYDIEKTTSDAKFCAKFQQDFYTTVILEKSKIMHIAQYVD
jgi:hypothetical protein